MTPPGLVAGLMQDESVAACAGQAGKSSQAYVAGAFDLRHVTLRAGQKMTVLIATDPCLALGQSTRIMIFEKTPQRYRRVLNEVTLPEFAQVRSDGTVTLPTHESMDVIFEATYVWTGTTYAFAPLRSHRYDVGLNERRPFEVPVHFARGASAAKLSGSVAYNFGDTYVFEALAGQTVTIELTAHTARRPRITLYYDDDISSLGEVGSNTKWSGKLQKSGTYRLLLSGGDESNESALSHYTIRLSITAPSGRARVSGPGSNYLAFGYVSFVSRRRRDVHREKGSDRIIWESTGAFPLCEDSLAGRSCRREKSS